MNRAVISHCFASLLLRVNACWKRPGVPWNFTRTLITRDSAGGTMIGKSSVAMHGHVVVPPKI